MPRWWMQPNGQTYNADDDIGFILSRPGVFEIDETSSKAAKLGDMDSILRCYTKVCERGWIRITTEQAELEAAKPKYGPVVAVFWFWKQYPYRDTDKHIPYDSVYPLIAGWLKGHSINPKSWVGLKEIATMAGWSQAVESLMLQDRRRDKKETCPRCGGFISHDELLNRRICPNCGWALA